MTWKSGAMTAVLVCAWLGAPPGSAQDGQLGQFRVPEYDEDGVRKSTLTGESASIRPDGNVDIDNFRLEFYESDGNTLRMAVTAPACTYNRSSRVAKSDSAVRIQGDKMVVTGKDFAWDGPREQFKIFKDAKVVLKGGGKSLSAGDEDTESSEE